MGSTEPSSPNAELGEAANLLAIEPYGHGGTDSIYRIAARMAMLAPDVIQGIIPLGTSMNYERERRKALGCWDGLEFCTRPSTLSPSQSAMTG